MSRPTAMMGIVALALVTHPFAQTSAAKSAAKVGEPGFSNAGGRSIPETISEEAIAALPTHSRMSFLDPVNLAPRVTANVDLTTQRGNRAPEVVTSW